MAPLSKLFSVVLYATGVFGVGLRTSDQRSKDTRCGTYTTPEDIANLEKAALAGTYDTTEDLLARQIHQNIKRDVAYPWGPVTIKTWIHVVANGTRFEDGYIPDSNLHAQMKVINERFAKSGFQFELQGITHTINPAWAVETWDGYTELEYKSKLRKGDYATLNIYYLTALLYGTLGYAYFPRSGAKPNTTEFIFDGVVNQYTTVPGGGELDLDSGNIAVHEIGHWLGLLHTFDSTFYWGRDPCEGPGDMIADTPQQASPTYGCPIGRDSCPNQPGLDPINNHMDYSDDTCGKEFTPLQIKRMWDMWFYFRKPRGCNADNCLRGLRAASIPGRFKESQEFCSTITQTIVTEVSLFKNYAVDACLGNAASRISSACSCLLEASPTLFPIPTYTDSPTSYPGSDYPWPTGSDYPSGTSNAIPSGTTIPRIKRWLHL